MGTQKFSAVFQKPILANIFLTLKNDKVNIQTNTHVHIGKGRDQDFFLNLQGTP